MVKYKDQRMNPFKYGTVVSGRDFCGRKELLKQLKNYIESSQNIVLFGERRIGKTSAACEAARRLKTARPLYIDLLGIKSIDTLCRRILRSCVMLEQKSGMIERIIKSLSSLRPSFTLDPITAMPTVTFDASIELKANSIPEVLTVIESLHGKKRTVVILDEFQDVLNINEAQEALALLRGKIQFQTDIPYIFIGSIRHKLSEIFTHHESPFFKSAIPISIEPIPYEEFSNFLKNKFADEKKVISNETLSNIFQMADNVSGDIQQLCESIWSVSSAGERIGQEHILKGLELIFSREQKSYENYITLLTNNQQKVLRAIALAGGKNVYSVSFLKSSGFNNPSSVRKAINRMISLNILFEKAGEYKFINPFFRAWLLARG